MEDKEAFYSKLKIQLEDTTTFPADYMYKFIVPSDGNQVAAISTIFDNKGAVINTKKSRTGKYVSVSIVLKVASSNEVIAYYKKVSPIKGIISL